MGRRKSLRVVLSIIATVALITTLVAVLANAPSTAVAKAVNEPNITADGSMDRDWGTNIVNGSLYNPEAYVPTLLLQELETEDTIMRYIVQQGKQGRGVWLKGNSTGYEELLDDSTFYPHGGDSFDIIGIYLYCSDTSGNGNNNNNNNNKNRKVAISIISRLPPEQLSDIAIFIGSCKAPAQHITSDWLSSYEPTITEEVPYPQLGICLNDRDRRGTVCNEPRWDTRGIHGTYVLIEDCYNRLGQAEVASRHYATIGIYITEVTLTIPKEYTTEIQSVHVCVEQCRNDALAVGVCNTEEIPEFTTIAIPIIVIFSLVLYFKNRKEHKGRK